MKNISCFLISLMILALSSPLGATSPHPQSVTGSILESKGVCSPNVANASAPVTIVCTGFSEKQTTEIISLLNRLYRRDSTQQDEILLKLDAVLDAVHKSGNRVISDERKEQILKSPWSTCAPMNVLVTAPRQDPEAQALAKQLNELIDKTGASTHPVRYAEIPRIPGKDADIRVEANQMAYCLKNWLFSGLGSDLKVYWDPWKNPDQDSKTAAQGRGPDWSYDLPVKVYIYPK